MSVSTRHFCREESIVAGEHLAGTGAHRASMLLVRWPKGRWTRMIDTASDMTNEEQALAAALTAGGRRVQLVDRKGETEGRHQLWLFPENLTCSVARADLARTLAAVARRDFTGWEVSDRRLLLVCAHGQKDRCCARWGFAAYKALAARAPDDLEVWESTHLGGCRLSASTLGLPAMTKHGRVEAQDANALIEAERQGRCLPRLWRGPCHLPPEAQAREVFQRLGQTQPPEPRQVTRPTTCAELDAGEKSVGQSWR